MYVCNNSGDTIKHDAWPVHTYVVFAFDWNVKRPAAHHSVAAQHAFVSRLDVVLHVDDRCLYTVFRVSGTISSTTRVTRSTQTPYHDELLSVVVKTPQGRAN